MIQMFTNFLWDMLFVFGWVESICCGCISIGSQELRIVIKTKEFTRIPHFHIIGVNEKFEFCVRLDEASYFNHSRDSKKLNEEQKKAIIQYLNDPFIQPGSGVTKWNFMATFWNLNSRQGRVGEGFLMPDYAKL